MFNFMDLLKGIGSMFGGGGSDSKAISPIGTMGTASVPEQQAANNYGLMPAIGKQGASMTGPAGKIGMQYANAGLQAPEVPNMMAMLQGVQQQQQQPRNMSVTQLINMMRGG